MVGCDDRPGYPPDRTVRGDRRPRDPFRASAGPAGRSGCPTPSWCAWPWPRCCWVPGPSTTGCGCATPGSGTCSPTCRNSPATTSGSRPPRRCWPRRWITWPGSARRWHDPVRLIDATPVPCGTSRETVQRSELAGWADYGYCAAHSRWYWGLKLYLVTTPDGMPVAWCLAGPKTRRTRGRRRTAGARRPHRRAAARADPHRRQGLRRPRLRGPGHRRLRAAPGPPGPPRRGAPARVHRLDPAVDRVGQRHPQGPARPRTPRRPHRRGHLRPHRPAAAGHGRRASGTTGPPANPSSDR